MVPSSFVERVEVIDPNMTSPDEPVIGNHGSSDTTEQDTVSAEVVGEGGRRGVEQPGVHTDTHDGGNVSTSSDVDVSGEKSGQVTSSRDRVGSDIEEQLNIDEASTDLSGSARLQQERGTKAVAQGEETYEGESRSSFRRWVDIQHSVHDMHNIPDLLTELGSGCRSDTDTEERGNDETHGQGDDLWPDSGTGGLRPGSEIRRVGNYLISFELLKSRNERTQSEHVVEARRNGDQHLPSESAAFESGWLPKDGSHTSGSSD